MNDVVGIFWVSLIDCHPLVQETHGPRWSRVSLAPNYCFQVIQHAYLHQQIDMGHPYRNLTGDPDWGWASRSSLQYVPNLCHGGHAFMLPSRVTHAGYGYTAAVCVETPLPMFCNTGALGAEVGHLGHLSICCTAWHVILTAQPCTIHTYIRVSTNGEAR